MARHLSELIDTRFSRRGFMGGAAGLAALASLPALAVPATPAPPFRFGSITHGVDDTHHVAAGYSARVLIRWGDPVLPGAPAFNPGAQTPEAQSRQFGYNNDFLGLVPFSRNRAMLCVNHEYPIPTLMFGDIFDDQGKFDRKRYTARHARIEQAALGASVVEIVRAGEGWQPVIGRRNRRVNALDSAIAVSGPAAGSPRLATNTDPSGRLVIGTLGNCAGGVTPWGTYLTAEENFDDYFIGTLATGHPETENYQRIGLHEPGKVRQPGSGIAAWGLFDPRFDLSKEPNEANRFGWIVEIDPLDPVARPVKRTALGRFKHEGAESIVNSDGRLVIYMGDDEVNEYLYRFVSRDQVSKNRAANRNLLDYGTLSVAVFNESGIEWRPLVFGEGPLTIGNGFKSQADVLIETRRAATLLGATPMDRPEDVEAHPSNGRVYLMLTNNRDRRPQEVNAPNPRGPNHFGHILELTAPGGDHAAPKFGWEPFVLCGPPNDPAACAKWGANTGPNDWFASPDNCAFDPHGRLWIATDQGGSWSRTGTADGLWALETDGPERGRGHMFFRVPVGAELCGPRFTRDNRSLFLSVQHPGADGTRNWKPFGRESTYRDPATRWPDFDASLPPRPSVVVVEREGGGSIAV